MTDTTRPSLLIRLQDPGDLEAWSRFESLYGPLIVSYALARGLQLSDAEDVRQTVLLGFTRAASGFSYDAARGRFRSYLGVCVRNAMNRHNRRHVGVVDGLDPNDAADARREDLTAEDELWDRQWMQHHYRLALRSLRKGAAPLSVRVLEGLLAGRTAQSLADELGMTPEAVRKVKQRMKDTLARLVREQIEHEEHGIQPERHRG